jgi:hypothetical protein
MTQWQDFALLLQNNSLWKQLSRKLDGLVDSWSSCVHPKGTVSQPPMLSIFGRKLWLLSRFRLELTTSFARR